MEIYTNLEEKFVIVADRSEFGDLKSALFYALRHWDELAEQEGNEMKETDHQISDKYLHHFDQLVQFDKKLNNTK